MARTSKAPRSPSQSDVPMRGRRSRGGAPPGELVELGRGEVGQIERGCLELRCGEGGGPALRLDQVRAGHRQMDREPVHPQVAQRGGGRGQLVPVQAVPRHRCLTLDDDPDLALATGQRLDVLDPSDRVDDPVVIGDAGEEGPPRAEHHDVAAERCQRAGDFVVRADGEHRAAERGGLGGQQVTAQAVAVALDDRHQSGCALREPAQVASPARGVDVQVEAHPLILRYAVNAR